MYSFLIADDHLIVRTGIKLLIGNNFKKSLFTETDSTKDLLQHVRKSVFDICIADVHLSDGNTLSVIDHIKAVQPGIRLLFLSTLSEEVYAKRIMSMGAHGFLHKRSKEPEIITAIKTLLEGNYYLSEQLSQRLARDVFAQKTENPFERLSNREFEVMIMMLNGRQTRDISEQLGLQISTVGTYKNRIFDKLEVQSLIDLNKKAALYGIL